MAIARHQRGVGAAISALASQVHPVFMLPAVATAVFGAILAPDPQVPTAAVHVLAVFFALYTAHVTDGLVDFYVRGEDDDHPLSRTGCRVALALSTAGFAACALVLGVVVGPLAALVTLPGWVIGYLHAPQLDTNPVTATTGYPLGIALALVGGFYVQAETVTPPVLGLAAVFLVTLSGIKVIDDAQDVVYDASIDKRTVAVVLGPRRARVVAFGLLLAGSIAAVCLAVGVDGLPNAAALAAVPFGVVVAIAARAGPERATMLLIRGSYLFLAVLVATVWFRPLGV